MCKLKMKNTTNPGFSINIHSLNYLHQNPWVFVSNTDSHILPKNYSSPKGVDPRNLYFFASRPGELDTHSSLKTVAFVHQVSALTVH